jgi:tripartite-type tricarboxylate transporter receptor subunit TctC
MPMPLSRRCTAALAVPVAALLASLSAAVLAASPAHAQSDWPRQPIRILVGFGAGGSNDIIARIVGQKLSERLGTPVVVENRTGANGNIAAEAVARAAPDGYTLGSAPTSIMIHNAVLFEKLPYDPLKSFVPISIVAAYPMYLSVNAELPVKSVKELLAHAKANPAKANYAGTTGIFQLVTELFKQKSQTNFEYIPFRSSAEMVTSLITGQAMMGFIDPAPLMPQVRAGKVRVIGVTAAKRSPDTPDAPTMEEAGFPGMEAEAFSAIVAPAGTPAPVVKRLNDELREIVKLPDVVERFKQLAANPFHNTPEEFAAFVAREIPRWREVAQKAGIKPQ